MGIRDQSLQLKQDFDDVYNAGYEKGKAEGGDTEQAFEDGKQAERKKFWERYQNRWTGSYFWAFGNNAFNDETYNPISPIICGAGEQASQSMFRENRLLTDTKVEIQTIALNMNYCFLGAIKLKTIRKITPLETTLFTGTFNNCTALENIEFGGTIGKSISFKDSPYLTTGAEGEVWSEGTPLAGQPSNSVQSIIDALMTITDGVARTVAFHADVKAKLTTEQIATITAKAEDGGKGWTLA